METTPAPIQSNRSFQLCLFVSFLLAACSPLSRGNDTSAPPAGADPGSVAPVFADDAGPPDPVASPECGNGLVEPGEECDAPGTPGCEYNCRCGEGYLPGDGICHDLDECATNNGECGDARFWSCTNRIGARPVCTDIDECRSDNGGCGDVHYWTCTNVVGGPPTCTDVDECLATNGGCGSSFYTCTNVVGGPPVCADIDECAVTNGGCGDPRRWACLNVMGAPPVCNDIDECLADNGGCGDARFWTCQNRVGDPPACVDVDECAHDNGGCGDATFWTCTNLLGALPVCNDINECTNNNGNCGDPTYWTCANALGAPPLCADIDECATDNGGCGHPVLFNCANRIGAAPTCTAIPEPTLPGNTVAGLVTGLARGDQGTVVLGNDAWLATRVITGQGKYQFDNVPDGHYFLKLEVSGYRAPATWKVHVDSHATLPLPARSVSFDFVTAPLPNDAFTFHWQDDDSRAGQQQTAYVNKPRVIIPVQGGDVEVPDLAAATTLEHDYSIVLSDAEVPWTQELAARLLETERQLPQKLRNNYAAQELTPSKWILTNDTLPNDIAVSWDQAGNVVRVSQAAFVDAAPRLVLLDGMRGTFFSKRLHHALTRFVTHDGNDAAAAEKILVERYGCTTAIPDYVALTAPTTAEDANSFQAFHPNELVELIDMFEEMPSGYHVVAGLKYLARRKDGMPHPIYNLSPAVAWALPETFPNGSYIEFMETTFTSDPDHMHRLILHEKGHFMWGYLFSNELKNEWMTLGGWYRDANAKSGWSTTKEVEFVSAYAHEKNPNEDMAESLAYFVLDPDALRSRSLPKFEFIRDRIMHGSQYIARVRPDLTFQVLNLFPDYAYPGKIKRVDVTVHGAPNEDKLATVEMELNVTDGVFNGASSGNFRLYSPIGTYVDVAMAPTNSAGSVLRGTFAIGKTAKSGFWYTDQVVLTDDVGSQRMEGVEDFGWRLLVDNPLEDVIPPQYVPGSLTVELVPDQVVEGGKTYQVQRVHVSWQINENRQMASSNCCYASLTNPQAIGQHALEAWGTFDPVTSRANVNFYITDFDTPGTYGVPWIMMTDAALNVKGQAFSASPRHEPLVTVDINTANADTLPPEVALNDDATAKLHKILVSAAPTHPNAPDGETLVHIRYQGRDDKSGIGIVSYRLLDPQGLSHVEYFYHANFYTLFFQGDPTAWTDYDMSVILPVGSAPGTWGLQELTLYDKAGNRQYYNFVETLEFDVAH